MVFRDRAKIRFSNQRNWVLKNMNLEAELGDRRRLTLDEYENLHENKLTPENSMLHSKKEFVLVDVKTDEESRGERRYVFNG